MNAREMKKILDERLVEAKMNFKNACKCFGCSHEITHEKAIQSCALTDIYVELFGHEEFEKLMRKHFPEDFRDEE